MGPRLPALGVCALAILLAAGSAGAFDLQAHRGGRGLRPENTLPAFEHALRLGVTTLELDMAITADGVAVISHDAALNPAITRDPRGRWLAQRGPLIHTLTLEQLRTYDVGRLDPDSRYGREFATQQPHDGTPIPTLAELFALVRRLGAEHVQFDIDTKVNPYHPRDTLAPEAFVDALLDVIGEAGTTGRVMVQSFDWRTLELLHRRAPQVRTMYLSIGTGDFRQVRDAAWTAGHRLEDHGGSVPRMVRASAGTAQGVIWAPYFRELTRDDVKEAQALGLQVIPWTVNAEADMEMLVDWGVDGIISDYPDRLRKVMARRGLPLPAPVSAPAATRK